MGCGVVMSKRLVPRARVRGLLGAVMAALLLWVAVGASGCGGVLSPDLFVVSRTGSTPGARLTMLVNEEGVVHCGADPTHLGSPHHLSDSQIIEARAIQEDLHDPATRHSSLPPAPGSVLRYYVRDQDGWVRFADNSRGQPSVMHRLPLFVLSVAQGVCGIPQQGA